MAFMKKSCPAGYMQVNKMEKDIMEKRNADSERFEIDKEAFGKFLAEQRKAIGYTQKELAGKLFISDKAVSKWERGLSMPDITLLLPLSNILGVSVTELLEGKRLQEDTGMDAEHVETLVKKALTLSEETPEAKLQRKRRHAAVFVGVSMLAIVEFVIGIYLLSRAGILSLSSGLLTLEGLSFVFGIYIWFFMKERLPGYYDENKINAYSDGVFRMNLPGSVGFNNSNWPHIVRSLRIWSAATLLLTPLICILHALLVPGFWLSFGIQQGMLIVYLGSLFGPLYVLARKYE